jgi:hypothetical protein
MKHSGALTIVAGLILIILWWNWPDWGRWEHWSSDTRVTCIRGQLTTMSPHDGGSLSPVAMNELVAAVIFEKPRDPLDPADPGRLERDFAEIPRRVERFFALVEQGHVIRVPAAKLVRYVKPAPFARWIVEVEVIRRGTTAIRGFANWRDLDCFPFRE